MSFLALFREKFCILAVDFDYSRTVVEKLSVNQAYILKHRKDIPMLFLYMKLRIYANQRGGYFKGYEFTKHERYEILPRLERSGVLLIKEQRLLSHRRSTKRGTDNITYVTIAKEYLESEKAFKGFMLAFAERYLLRLSHRSFKPVEMSTSDVESVIRDRDWYASVAEEMDFSYHRGQFCKSQNEISDRGMTKDKKVLKGIISRETIAKFLGVSVASVKRWRKNSPNVYTYGRIYSDSYRIIKDHFNKAKELGMHLPTDTLDYFQFSIDYSRNGFFDDKDELPIEDTVKAARALSEIQDNIMTGEFAGFMVSNYGFRHVHIRRVCDITTMVEFAEPKVATRLSTILGNYQRPSREKKEKKHRDVSKIRYGRGELSDRRMNYAVRGKGSKYEVVHPYQKMGQKSHFSDK